VGSITTYFKHLRFDGVGTCGTRTHDLTGVKREHYHEATATSISNTKVISHHFFVLVESRKVFQSTYHLKDIAKVKVFNKEIKHQGHKVKFDDTHEKDLSQGIIV
jgi:hypothetical protein